MNKLLKKFFKYYVITKKIFIFSGFSFFTFNFTTPDLRQDIWTWTHKVEIFRKIYLKRRAMEHSIKENVPTLSMPIFYEGDEIPELSIWKLPVATAQVGWVTDPDIEALGVVGCALITMLVLALDVHPSVLVTVNV